MVDIPDDEYEERIARARLAREEARQTIDEQTATLSDIDEKAIQIFRINLVVASILVTGLSIAVSAEDVSLDVLITPYTTTGGVLLFTSIILSSVTYTSTSERIGIAKEAIEDSILNQKYDYDLIEEEIALEYGRMIRYNFEKNASNALLFTLTLLVAVGSIFYLTLGIVDIHNSITLHPYSNLVIIGFFLLFGKVSGLYGTTRRWWKLTDPPRRFETWFLNWKNQISDLLSDGEDT
ncbi:hypothetical protein NGM10_11915 [Halorussus salilacus]|uniref:hypothetical protein n=1 Tax=Halorussus salilacus TaxID=2953750 RepID=UPI00209DB2C4|nr:hypothetical protein [Halorussus salilacus]USZ67431.1 hypothetical protein NGM10_11915 [Halorussus salilacus]